MFDKIEIKVETNMYELQLQISASNSDPTTPAIPFDWKMAQEEVMRADLNNDPIQAAIARLERQVCWKWYIIYAIHKIF